MNYVILALLAFVVFIGVEVFIRMTARRISDKAMQAFISGETDEFMRLMESRMAKITIPSFNRDFFKLNFYMGTNNAAKVKELSTEMDTKRMAPLQRVEFMMKRYEFALMRGDLKEMKKLITELRTFVESSKLKNKDEIIGKLDLDEAIFIRFDRDALPAVEQIIEAAPEEMKAVWYYRKAMIYHENKDEDQALTAIEKAIEIETVDMNKDEYKKYRKKITRN